METDWQTYAAAAVVVLTVVVFAIRLTRGRRGGCGGACGCAKNGATRRR